MFIAPLLQFTACFLVLRWLLKRKPGQPFSKKAIVRYLLLGALSVVVCLGLTFVLPVKRDTFVGDPSTLSGITEETLAALPYYGYMMPLLACAVITIVGTFIALIVMLRKIDAWSKTGEKQEPLA